MNEEKLKYVNIKKSKIHNNGVFAKSDIKKDTKIIEYVGEKISKDEAENRVTQTINNANEQNGAVYIFELDKETDIDGNVPYNHAKYINHSCNPNCETEIIDNEIWIIALKNIKKGEELFYNYGYDIEDYEDHPCKCGSDNCVGYIVDEDHWTELKRILKKKTG
jgi:uncharacterized protein